MFEMLTWTEFCWLSDWNLSKTNKKVNVVHVYEWMDKQQWHEWWYCNQINKSNQIKLYLYGTFKKVFQTALQRFTNNNRKRETANLIKRRWLGSEHGWAARPEAWRKLPLGASHTERDPGPRLQGAPPQRPPQPTRQTEGPAPRCRAL